MNIEIDKRSEVSAYITLGNVVIYVEHSDVAPEHILIWKSGEMTANIFEHNGDPYFYEPLEAKGKA